MKDNALVFIKNDTPLTTSLIVADGTQNEHRSIIRLIQNYAEQFKRWGKIGFTDLKSTNPDGGRPTKVALLNEQQATFLITLLRNNDIVVAFKSELVDQFFKMREMLARPKIERDARWIQTRQGTKTSHRPFTDAIKLLIEYLESRGARLPEASWVYGHLTNLIQSRCDIKRGQRDNSPVANLNKLDQVQNMVANVIVRLIVGGKVCTLAEFEANIILQLDALNRLLGGDMPLLGG